MKKAIVRTRISEYLLEVQEALGRELVPQDVFDQLGNIYQHLKNDPENLLGNITLDQFVQGAQVGFQKFQMEEALNQHFRR